METGYWLKGTRAKEGAYDTIDDVTKFALDDSDYEEYEEWVEYTPEEIAERERAKSAVTAEELMEAIAELGALVASMKQK